MAGSENVQALSDFSSLPRSYGAASYTLAGGRYERLEGIPSIYVIPKGSAPSTFPMRSWDDQSARYDAYWKWFNGDILNQTKTGKDGETLFRYPLRINTLRDVVRKHTSILFGEAPDGTKPLVEAKVKARASLSGDTPSEDSKSFATICENICNEVWLQSGGRAIQQEGGELTQFLGGHYYQITYEPDHDDWIVPIGIRSWKADFVLPVWKDSNNYQELSEVYIVYLLETAVAKNQFPDMDLNGNTLLIYVEWWSESQHSAFINNVPIKLRVKGELVTFENLPNPYEKVPVFYVPHMREGSFFGNSHIPDIAGLMQEYNASMADLSDTISDNLRRLRFIRNSSKRTPVELPGGVPAIDLGMQNPSIHNPPDSFTEDPPQISDGLSKHPNAIYQQLRRSAFLPPVAEGEDEGSQRSGITLDIRFWPVTAHTKNERSNWEATLNQIDKFILRVMHKMELWNDVKPGLVVKDDFLKTIAISQKWYPQIPRDRQSLVNELLSRLGGDGLSLEKFVADIGDVENEEEEMDMIKAWMEFKNGLELKKKAQAGSPLQASGFSKQNNNIDQSQ